MATKIVIMHRPAIVTDYYRCENLMCKERVQNKLPAGVVCEPPVRVEKLNLGGYKRSLVLCCNCAPMLDRKSGCDIQVLQGPDGDD